MWFIISAGEASIHGGGVGGFRMVEAKYPALLFKQQLDAFVQKIFPMMRDNVKKNITPMLVSSMTHASLQTCDEWSMCDVFLRLSAAPWLVL